MKPFIIIGERCKTLYTFVQARPSTVISKYYEKADVVVSLFVLFKTLHTLFLWTMIKHNLPSQQPAGFSSANYNKIENHEIYNHLYEKVHE